MATTFVEDFDDLTDGVAVTTANTSFDEATGTATFTADTTDAIGAACCLFAASSQQGLLRNLQGSTVGTRYMRVYLRPDAVSSFASILAFRFDFTSRARVGLTAGRVLQLYDGGTNVASTTALTLGQWYRIEWKVDNGVEQRLRLFTGSNLHGATPDEEIFGAATQGTFNNFVFGSLGSTTQTVAYDQFAVDDTTWAGPHSTPPVVLVAPAVIAAPTTTPPTVLGGSVLTGPQAIVAPVTTAPLLRAGVKVDAPAATGTAVTAAPTVRAGVLLAAPTVTLEPQTFAPTVLTPVPPPEILDPQAAMVANLAGATLTGNTADATLTANSATAALVTNQAEATWRPGVSQLKQNDTAPAAVANLTDGGTPVNLTTATGVNFHMTGKGQSPKTVTGAATIVDATGGKVKYAWVAGDTDTPDTYDVEWEVTWGDGTVQTFPPSAYLTLTISAELDTTP